MPFPDYVNQAEELFAGVSRILDRIERNELRVTRAAERDLRGILLTLSREVQYRRLGGLDRVDFSAPATRRARNKALRELEGWRTKYLGRFRALDPAATFTAGEKLAEMETIAGQAAGTWSSLVRRISAVDSRGRPRFTRAQIAEAKQLSRDTAFFRRQFGNTRAFLEANMVEASFGKVENLAATIEHAHRNARNDVARLGTGAPLGRGGRVVESNRADLANLIATAGIDRSRLVQSARAHAHGLFNAGLIRIAEALGVTHFMMFVCKADRARLNPAGILATYVDQVRLGEPNAQGINLGLLADRVAAAVGRPRADVMVEARRRAMQGGNGGAAGTRRMLFRILTEAEELEPWPVVFDKVNAGRRSTVSWAGGLGIHHNSCEFFLPIPPSMLEAARAWSATKRAA